MEKKLFGQMSVGAKLMGFYILFGLIPLVIAYLYTFHVLRRILVEDGYRYIRQEAQRLEGQMNMWTDRYSIMIDSIYMDYYTNAYLMTDYNGIGYENMYPYIDKFLLKLSLLCQEKPDMGFYSYNRTLPGDRNYFNNRTRGTETEISPPDSRVRVVVKRPWRPAASPCLRVWRTCRNMGWKNRICAL